MIQTLSCIPQTDKLTLPMMAVSATHSGPPRTPSENPFPIPNHLISPQCSSFSVHSYRLSPLSVWSHALIMHQYIKNDYSPLLTRSNMNRNGLFCLFSGARINLEIMNVYILFHISIIVGVHVPRCCRLDVYSSKVMNQCH